MRTFTVAKDSPSKFIKDVTGKRIAFPEKIEAELNTLRPSAPARR